MKRAFYKYFRPNVFHRWKIIQLKKRIRKAAIEWTINYLNEWNDIPLSYLIGDVCTKLQIKNNNSALCFAYDLIVGRIDRLQAEKLLPLPQNINIK